MFRRVFVGDEGPFPLGSSCRIPPAAYAAPAATGEKTMFEWPDEMQLIRDAVRQFVDNEIRPHREELEHGDLPPYDLLRKLYRAFGIDQMARDTFKRRIEAERTGDAAAPRERSGGGAGAGMTILPIIELCKCSPGMVTAM